MRVRRPAISFRHLLFGLLILLPAASGLVLGHTLAAPTPEGVGANRAAPPPGSSAAAVLAATQANLAPSGRQVLLPILDYTGENLPCSAWTTVQNLGEAPGKAVLVAWHLADDGEGCEGPMAVHCTGLLRPGDAWHLQHIGARSGVLFSFRADRLSAIGVTRPEDDVIADYLCERLNADLVGDCDAYAAFKRAFDTGGTYAEVPIDQAMGGPLAVSVLRTCAAPRIPGAQFNAAYEGLGADTFGQPTGSPPMYTYHAFPVRWPPWNQVTDVYVQNGGAADATVEVWAVPEARESAGSPCPPGNRCPTIPPLRPGESVTLPLTACLSANWIGSLRLQSDQPLGVVVEQGLGDTYATVVAVPHVTTHDVTGQPVPGTGAVAVAGAPAFGSEHGWTTEVTVQNLDTERAATVQVEAAASGGFEAEIVATGDPICPGGSATLTIPAAEYRPGITTRTLRVVSKAPAGATAAPIGAVAILTRLDEGGAALERVGYNLRPGAVAGTREPTAARGPDHAATVLPLWPKDLHLTGVGGELALANLVAEPGWTDVTVALFDQNGLVEVLCRRLGALSTEYVDAQVHGALFNGFIGTAVVSATAWHHPDPSPGGDARSDLVDLAAGVVLRSRTVLQEDGPGDEAAACMGPALERLPPALAAAIGQPCDPAPPARVAAALAAPRGDALAAQVHLPGLARKGSAEECSATVTVSNPGDAAAKVVLVTWAEEHFCPPESAGPAAIRCSGLLAPGETWVFGADDLGGGAAVSGAVFGFNIRTLDDIGAVPGSDEMVADRLCAALGTQLVGDGDAYRRFRLAFDHGLAFAGVPLAQTYSQRLEVEVERACPDDAVAGQTNTSTYRGLPGTEVHRPDATDGTFRYAVSGVYAHQDSAASWLFLQNAGTECATIDLELHADGQCLAGLHVAVFSVAPGEAAAVAMDEFVTAFFGSVMLHADQPLAVALDTYGPSLQRTRTAFASRSPFDIDGDGSLDPDDLAAMDDAIGTPRSSPLWNGRADLNDDGEVDAIDRTLFLGNTCGYHLPDPPPPGAVPGRRDNQVLLPVLDALDDQAECAHAISVQNLGDRVVKPVLVLWDDYTPEGGSCVGPAAVECGGLLAPGRSWHVAAGQVAAQYGVLFNLSSATMAQVGASPASEDLAADVLCGLLREQVVGDCAGYARFKAAFDGGGSFEGIPLDRAAGGPVAALVTRTCPTGFGPGNTAASSYLGVGAHAFGRLDPGSGAYRYIVPWTISDRASFDSRIFIQNGGSEPAVVRIEATWHYQYGITKASGPWTVNPGETLRLDAAELLDRSTSGSLIVLGSAPLGIVAETTGRHTLAQAHAAATDGVAHDAAGRALPASPGTALFGPLIRDARDAWDVGLFVFNHSPNRPARIRVEFRDAHGEPVSTLDDFVAPLGETPMFAPVIDARGAGTVGSVRVFSQPLADDPAAGPAPISGLVTLLHYEDPMRGTALALASYPLLAASQVFVWPDGSGEGGLASGTGVVAVPEVAIDAVHRTELVVHNAVPVPGSTDVAVLLYDDDQLVDVRCLSLLAGETAAVDLSSLSALTGGFRGSAVVSATAWRHPFEDRATGTTRNLVGLAAAVEHWAGPEAGANDPVAAEAGVPLRALPWSADEAVTAFCGPSERATIYLPIGKRLE